MQENPKVEIKLVADLTPDEYAQCRRLGYLRDGCIRGDVAKCRKATWSRSQAVMAKDATGRIRSWALIDRTYPGGRAMVQFWTQHRYRRKGLGRAVVEGVKTQLGQAFSHFRHDNPKFFDATAVKRA